MRKIIKLVLILALLPVSSFAQYRSQAAKNAFKKMQPCPATGLSKGRCQGYIIDHINPLACGGADAPFNMQWQTTADAKQKDKWERKTCKK